jgi:hypothetical protein
VLPDAAVPLFPSLCSPFEAHHKHPSPSVVLSSAPVAELSPPLTVFQAATTIFPLHGELDLRAPFSSVGWSPTSPVSSSSCRTSSPPSPTNVDELPPFFPLTVNPQLG